MKTKERILFGAKEFLRKNGQVGFTVRAIAKEADVNPGLVHHYFGSKENLVLELVDYVAEEPFQKIKQFSVGKTKEEIRNIILEFMLKNSELISLMIEFIYFAQHSPVVKQKVKDIMRVRREFMTEILGIENDEERYAFNAGLFGIIFVNRMDENVDLEVAIQKLFERFNLM